MEAAHGSDLWEPVSPSSLQGWNEPPKMHVGVHATLNAVLSGAEWDKGRLRAGSSKMSWGLFQLVDTALGKDRSIYQ